MKLAMGGSRFALTALVGTGLVGIGLAGAGLAGAAPARQAQPQVQPRPQVLPNIPPRISPAPVPGDVVVRERVPVAAFLPNTQALFEGYVRDNKMPGIVGAFGVGDGPTLFPSAGRIAEVAGAPAATEDSLWRVYSMTKPITAFAAMLLIEEGKLRLDQPISDFFPGFKSMRVLTSPDTSLASVPAKNPITVRNLLTHTAGLGYNIISKGPIRAEYERRGILPGALDAKSELQARTVRPRTLAAFAERAATLPLIAEPGTKWSYSIGLDIMGAVIEKASGMPFDTFVNTRIFKPLGMASSYWTVPASAVPRLATNYAWVGDTRVPLDPGARSVWLTPPSFPYGGAGLVMSARDYDRFLHMLADGGALGGVRLAKAETVALMMSNLLPAGVTFPGIGGGTGGTTAPVPMGYGAGGSVFLADGPGGFPGKGTYGWGGAAGTIAYVDPSKHFRATIMVNYFPSEKWPLRAEVARALAQDAARLSR